MGFLGVELLKVMRSIVYATCTYIYHGKYTNMLLKLFNTIV